MCGGAVFFLVTWERRIQRSRVLKALHVLRSFAHIIDMHQLTKDSERMVGSGQSTPSSPKRSLSPFELTRYLDYCSEMLALISKIGALYVQRIEDPADPLGGRRPRGPDDRALAQHLAEDHHPRPDPEPRRAPGRARAPQRLTPASRERS